METEPNKETGALDSGLEPGGDGMRGCPKESHWAIPDLYWAGHFQERTTKDGININVSGQSCRVGWVS